MESSEFVASGARSVFGAAGANFCGVGGNSALDGRQKIFWYPQGATATAIAS